MFLTYLKKIIRYFFSPKKEPPSGWFGNYSNWQEVSALCNGYEDAAIFEKVKQAGLAVKKGEASFERDSVLFYQEEHDAYFLEILNSLPLKNNTLTIIDFGGSLGSLYFQYKSKLQSFHAVNWNVIEQAHFVEFGKKELTTTQLKFYYTINDSLAINPNVDLLILSSVISYFEKPYELLSQMIQHKFKYILIDKTIFGTTENDLLTLQIVPPQIYKASYPCWVLNENKLINFVSEWYELKAEYDSYNSLKVNIDDKTAYFKALLFKLK
jgi:putative methyltransferase (TIGR04325 family)